MQLLFNSENLPLIQCLSSHLKARSIRPAILPIRFYPSEGSEEEVPEDMDPEDLFRQVTFKQMPAFGWRWNRSSWDRFCPVSLYHGQKVIGKPSHAVG
ncbi:unnamed protein product [Protopolystoma xenopodis]|uniref:Uncharacterized protein n=1 Tax=Protopolystoma xenopodis TaxID=117903 RepID=A0A3S5AK07_9PLAT|nr:unnamed protein product [Protopolystoma xenopodis]